MRVRAPAQPRIDRAEPRPLQHDSNRRLTPSTYGRWFKRRDHFQHEPDLIGRRGTERLEAHPCPLRARAT